MGLTALSVPGCAMPNLPEAPCGWARCAHCTAAHVRRPGPPPAGVQKKRPLSRPFPIPLRTRFADLQPPEAGHLDARLLEHLADGLLVILHERLLEQHALAVPAI